VRYLIFKWFWIAVDWVFPPICAGCGKHGMTWCRDCQSQVRRISPPLCDICGQKKAEAGVCVRCLRHPPRITAIRSYAIFGGPIRNALHRLKYQRNVGLGGTFSQSLVEVLGSVDWKISLVVPVPLGVARLKERGYNQASLLAMPVALKCGYPYYRHALLRTRETKSQVDLAREQRKLNVAGAFKARPEYIKGKNILVVDDVTTSGATLEACADALFAAGALFVYGLTLARAE